MGVARHQRDGAAVRLGGLVQTLLQLQRQAQVIVRFGIIGRQGDGPAAGRFGICGTA